MYLKVLFVLLTFVALAIARCDSNDHCPQCHVCAENGQCVQVPAMTDPNGDCGDTLMCGVRAVCGPMAHCVLERQPDWTKCDSFAVEKKEEKIPEIQIYQEEKITPPVPFDPEDDQSSDNIKADIGVFVMSFFFLASFCTAVLAIIGMHGKSDKKTASPKEQTDLPIKGPQFIRQDYYEYRKIPNKD